MPSISVLNGFEYLGRNYDFTRQGFATLEDMKNFSANYLPKVYVATCEEDGGVYVYNESNSIDDITGKWRLLSGGTTGDMLNYYTKNKTDELLNLKADADSVYTKDETYNKNETDNLLSDKANVIDVYTKTETDTLLDTKANQSTTYTKVETDDLLDTKADKVTTYTKTQTDTLLAAKADSDIVYTKTQTDTLLDTKANQATTYTKVEVDSLLENKIDSTDLAAVATSGSYNDLIDTPDIDTILSTTSENAVQNKVIALKFEDVANEISTIDAEVDLKVAQTVYDAKIAEIEHILEVLGQSTAKVVDAQPTLNLDGTVSYTKGGTTYTDEDDEIWYYYVDSETGRLMQSIVIANTLLTIESAGGIDFDVYLNRNTDVIHTYVGDEVDDAQKKIPDIQALQALETIINNKLDLKVNTTTYTQGQAEQDIEIAKKVNSDDVYTKTEIDDIIDTLPTADDVYTKSQTDALLDNKANSTDVYTKIQTDALLDDKANKNTTYTKTEVDTFIQTLTDDKADKTTVYTKTQTDTLLDEKVNTTDFADYKNDVLASLDSKVDKAQGETNGNKILGTDDDGNVTLLNPSSLGNSAENISYDNEDFSTYTNVKLALDGILEKLYYVEPKIVSFTTEPAVYEYEIGQSIPSVSFTWEVNKPITAQTLTDCTIENDDRTTQYDTPITSNKTFTLSVSDGENSATVSKTFSFKHKIYWGSAEEPLTGYDSSWVLMLSNNKLVSSPNGSYNFNVGVGEYGYFAMPASMKKDSAWVNGFNVDLEDCGNISFTNASGNTSTFSIVRFMQKSLAAFTAEIK